MLSQAKKLSEQSMQDDETAEMIERLNLFEIQHHNDKNAWYQVGDGHSISDRQLKLIRMYRNEAQQDIGNAFRTIAPAEEYERGNK